MTADERALLHDFPPLAAQPLVWLDTRHHMPSRTVKPACDRGTMSVEIPVRGAFDLTASIRFLERFAPAARPDAGSEPGTLRLAFPAAPSWRPVGVLARQNGAVSVEVFGEDVEAAAAHAARILSLDVDGSGFASVGARDPVIAALQRRYAGLRPVLFHSPYEAACWAIIGQRLQIVQATAIKQRIAQRLGDYVDVAGVKLVSFPSPRRLLEADHLPGLPPIKAERLKGIAAAALDGVLAPDRLRSMEPGDTSTDLQQLPGIGPFSAELILVRGVGHPDVFPAFERRLHGEMARAYGLNDPGFAVLVAIAETWRPYRSWAGFLLRVSREDRTAEIGAR